MTAEANGRSLEPLTAAEASKSDRWAKQVDTPLTDPSTGRIGYTALGRHRTLDARPTPPASSVHARILPVSVFNAKRAVGPWNQMRAALAPKTFHIDRRADRIVAGNLGADDELLTTRAVAAWLEVSPQWLEIGRHRGYGPPFKKLSPRNIRYRRGDLLNWLRSRTHSSTAEYNHDAAGA
jgi:hypothetical protein